MGRLTAEQQAEREGKLTASRVSVLMKGDGAGILRLYEEMIGIAQPENLDDVWAVQLGAVTEELNLDWYERKSGNPVVDRGKVFTMNSLHWAAATLDGWDDWLRCPVECKHVGGREPIEIVIDRYQPQMQWQMLVTDATQCVLSVIEGASEPRIEYIDRHDPYIATMLERASYFMMCVDLKRPPVELAPVPPPIDPTEIINMQGNNLWASHAADWLANREAAKICEDAKALLKELVPPNAKRAFGHGVKISRNKAGALSLREDR